MSIDALPRVDAVARRSVTERASWFVWGAVLSGALALRCVGLDHLPGINGDEAYYVVHARSFIDGAPLASLRTGTGLPMNAPFFGLVVLLSALLEPSALTLRLAALIHSWLAIAIVFALFRRRGLDFAAVFTCLVATLPIHLAYARFAWDAAAIPGAVALALAAATRLQPYWTALACVVCLWVHPVTVFVLPLMAAPFIVRAWPRAAHGGLRMPSVRVFALVALAFAGVALGCALAVSFQLVPDGVSSALQSRRVAQMFQRSMSPLAALTFLRLYAELLCGPTIYRYIAGSISPAAGGLHLLGFVGCVAPLLFFAVRRLKAEQQWAELALMLGLLASLAFAYVVGGLKIFTPGTERYGICFAVPSCYVFASCVQTLSTDVRREAWLRFGVAAVGVALTLSFAINHLAALYHQDPSRENAFRTGDQDPKLLALEAVLRVRDPNRTTLILAQDWWIYWPVRYLAQREPNLRVTVFRQPWDARFPADFRTAGVPADAQLFAIAWAGGPFDDFLRPQELTRIAVRGYEPEPILQVVQLPSRQPH